MEEIYGDYDYEIPNEEILSTQEKKQVVITEIKNLFLHTAHKFNNAAQVIGSQNKTPQFNSQLNIPNLIQKSRYRR